jgi:ribosomal protein S15P/S13E
MGKDTPKQPWPAKRRTLPPDSASLTAMIGAVHRELGQKVRHLKAEPHDYRARRGLEALFNKRAEAFKTLHALNQDTALCLAGELGITKGVVS